MGVNVTPPQGLIAITTQPIKYGMPLGIPTGGAGTGVTIILPPTYMMGSGQCFHLIGTYEPAVWPPVVQFPSYNYPHGAGMQMSIVSGIQHPQDVSAIRAVIIADDDIIKVRQSSAFNLDGVTVLTI